MTLTPSLSSYPLGSEITCSADGDPPLSYQWQSAEDGDGMNKTWTDIIDETRKAFTPSKAKQHNGTIYRCAANNTIRGKSFVAYSKEFRVNGNSGDTGSASNNSHRLVLIKVSFNFLLLTYSRSIA